MRILLLGLLMAITAVTDISGLVLDINPHTGSYADTGGTTPASVDGAVARVNDVGGGAYHVTQATESARPTLKQDANGWKYLRSDGSDDALTNASFTPTVSGAQPFTVVVVLRSLEFTTGHPIWVDGSQRAYNQRDSRDYQLLFGATLGRGVPNGDLRNHICIVNGASSAVYIDGTLQGTAGNAGTVAWTAGLNISHRPSNGTYGQNDTYRLLAWNKVLSGTEITDLASYLTSLYGSAPPSGEEPASRKASHFWRLMAA